MHSTYLVNNLLMLWKLFQSDKSVFEKCPRFRQCDSVDFNARFSADEIYFLNGGSFATAVETIHLFRMGYHSTTRTFSQVFKFLRSSTLH